MEKFTCPTCGASYRYDAKKVPLEGARLTCPACNQKWHVRASGETVKAVDAQRQGERRTDSTSCPKCGHHFDPAAPRKTRSVLVVDDQEFFRNFAVETLARDFKVHIAKNIEEAVLRAEEHHPDLVVLDLGLERGADDGKEVLRRLDRRYPVIILTGRTDFDQFGGDWQELVDLGARELVIKGFQMDDDLRSKIERIFAPA